MNQKLKEKTKESLTAVLPITIIVLLLTMTIAPVPAGTILLFLVGAFLLIIGMGLFSLGADLAMMPMGEGVGAQLTKSKKVGLVLIVYFFLGFIITIAEPDLQVLAHQVPSIPNMTLIITVAIGVGIFLVASMLRMIFKIRLSYLLIFFYLIVFVVATFAPDSFLALAFDSGGVTTGPITVPFIMALGIGMSSVRGDKDSQDDSFGLIALCSIGPILAVMILSIVYNPQNASYTATHIPEIATTRDAIREFALELPEYFKEVALAIGPIAVFFGVFQLFTKRFNKRNIIRILIGLVYTYVGLVLFLTGVNVGFIPAGSLIGATLSASAFKWLLIPIGALVGYFIVSAEPAVHVLNKQVEEISNGAISAKAMSIALSVGVSASLAIAMLRVLTGISIFWFLIPGYIIALGLSFVVPKIFTGIAFDSGGVASGPMTSTFLLPFTIGACESIGGNVMTDAFGVVAMVAMTPLITIQIMGLIYTVKMKNATSMKTVDTDPEDDIIEYIEEDNIIDYEEEHSNG